MNGTVISPVISSDWKVVVLIAPGFVALFGSLVAKNLEFDSWHFPQARRIMDDRKANILEVEGISLWR